MYSYSMLNENVFYLNQTFKSIKKHTSGNEGNFYKFSEKINTAIKICLKYYLNTSQSLDEAKFQIFSFLVAKCVDQEDATHFMNFETCIELMIDNEFKDFARVNRINDSLMNFFLILII